MIKKCGKCVNLYTWDCPRIEPSCDDRDVCAMYSEEPMVYVDENGHVRSDEE